MKIVRTKCTCYDTNRLLNRSRQSVSKKSTLVDPKFAKQTSSSFEKLQSDCPNLIAKILDLV